MFIDPRLLFLFQCQRLDLFQIKFSSGFITFEPKRDDEEKKSTFLETRYVVPPQKLRTSLLPMLQIDAVPILYWTTDVVVTHQWLLG